MNRHYVTWYFERRFVDGPAEDWRVHTTRRDIFRDEANNVLAAMRRDSSAGTECRMRAVRFTEEEIVVTAPEPGLRTASAWA